MSYNDSDLKEHGEKFNGTDAANDNSGGTLKVGQQTQQVVALENNSIAKLKV